jgi:hypothetical protein
MVGVLRQAEMAEIGEVWHFGAGTPNARPVDP